jgi:hypothetical protein
MATNLPLAFVSDKYDDVSTLRKTLEHRLGSKIEVFSTPSDFLIAAEATGYDKYCGLLIEPLSKAYGGDFKDRHPIIPEHHVGDELETYFAPTSLDAVVHARKNMPGKSIIVLSALDAENDIFFLDASKRYIAAGATAFEEKPSAGVDVIADYFRNTEL